MIGPMIKHSTLLSFYEQYPNSVRFNVINPREVFATIDAELIRLLGSKKQVTTPSDESIKKILAFAKQKK